MVIFLATPLGADNTNCLVFSKDRLAGRLLRTSSPRCFWCGWSSDCTAPTTTCYPPWESRTQAALVRSYRLSYWLTKPRVSRKNKHEQRLQCMGQSAGSFSIWPRWSYSHGRLSFPCAIIYHNFEGQRKKPTLWFSYWGYSLSTSFFENHFLSLLPAPFHHLSPNSPKNSETQSNSVRFFF